MLVEKSGKHGSTQQVVVHHVTAHGLIGATVPVYEANRVFKDNCDSGFVRHLVEELDKDGQKLLVQDETIAKLTKELNELKAENAKLLYDAIEGIELRSEIEDLKDELAKAEKVKTSLIEELLKYPYVKSEVNELKTVLEKLNKENATLKEDLRQVKSELDESKRKIQSLQINASPLPSSQCNTDQLLCKMDELRQDISNACSDL